MIQRICDEDIELSPLTVTNEERDVIVRILRDVDIPHLGDAIVVTRVYEGLLALKATI